MPDVRPEAACRRLDCTSGHCSAERFGVQTAGRQADAQQWKWCTLPAHAHAQEGVGKMLVVGVDGCPGGWLAMAYDAEAGTFTPEIHATFRAVLDAYPGAASVAIDVPIGLIEDASRRCDLEARRVLGPRRSSVFPAPDPRIVDAPTYAEASSHSRALTGKGISVQAFGIFPKVAEANALLTPALQEKVIEVHPELSFWALAQERPMVHAKRTPDGFDERRMLLVGAFAGTHIPTNDEARRLARPAAADDVLDAIVAAWTARRYAEGRSGRLPVEPQIDAKGLRVEMVY